MIIKHLFTTHAEKPFVNLKKEFLEPEVDELA